MLEAITPASGGQNFSLTGSMGNAQASQEQFLNLLVSQLKNQNPFEPIKNEDFISQLATFSQLEEQQKTNLAIQDLIALQSAGLVLGGLSQGASLVGKEVTYVDPESQEFVTGIVSSVAFDPTGVLLTIDGKTVPVGNIVGISTASAPNNSNTTQEPAPPADPANPAVPPPATAASEDPPASSGNSTSSEE